MHHEHLDIALQHRERDPKSLDVAFLNSKGFGGNNATASVLAPHFVERMLAKRHGEHALVDYRKRNEVVEEQSAAYDARASRGDLNAIYRFGQGLVDESAIEISTDSVTLPGMPAVALPDSNPFDDMV